MKSLRKALVGAAAIATLGAALGTAAISMPAFADDAFKFSFDVGNVRLGYSDGYWDTGHHWHAWRNAREAREFQSRYHDRYVGDKHTRFKNAGWRDNDGDGIPNRLDDHPNNPRRN